MSTGGTVSLIVSFQEYQIITTDQSDWGVGIISKGFQSELLSDKTYGLIRDSFLVH